MLISRMLKLSAVSIFYTFKNRYRCPESYEAFQNVQTNVIDLLVHEFGDSKNARRSKEEIETIQQALGGGEARKRKDDNTHTSAAARCTKSHSGEYMLTHSVKSTTRECIHVPALCIWSNAQEDQSRWTRAPWPRMKCRAEV